ncbi:MAG TPA: hypothetical protein VEV45_20700 [Streptosporangiaceae bacterium]|nr:hypothetical protein [Streptosporangiaceae bacterium]
MKVLADWDEAYPALFLTIEGDEIALEYDQQQLARYGREVPDELATRWREARDTWHATAEEIRVYFGADP